MVYGCDRFGVFSKNSDLFNHVYLAVFSVPHRLLGLAHMNLEQWQQDPCKFNQTEMSIELRKWAGGYNFGEELLAVYHCWVKESQFVRD